MSMNTNSSRKPRHVPLRTRVPDCPAPGHALPGLHSRRLTTLRSLCICLVVAAVAMLLATIGFGSGVSSASASVAASGFSAMQSGSCPVDLFYGKTVSVSSTFQNAIGPRAVDGNDLTEWGSLGWPNSTGIPEWLVVDLGPTSPPTVRSVRLVHKSSATCWNPVHMRLEGSNDNSTWQLIHSFDQLLVGETVLDLPTPTTYRYYRYYVTQLNGNTCGTALYTFSGFDLTGPTCTPTPTATNTLTRTPTNTPPVACTPTAVCQQITPPVGTAPKEAVSYYIQDWPPESDFYYDAGFQAGVEANSPTPQDVVIILDFNKPAIYEAGPIQIWGTRVLDSYDFMNFDAIMGSSVEFAEGFVAGANGSGARLWLGVGTNNFQKDALRELTVDEYRSHGANWAYLVEQISTDLRQFADIIFVEGASDIEFNWSDSSHGIAWIEGYRDGSQGTGHILYNYGSCDGCYPECGGCSLENNTVLGGDNFTWQRSDALYAIHGNGAVRQLPEIYYPSPCLDQGICGGRPSSRRDAIQWSSLSLYSATNVVNNHCYGPLSFAGVFTGWRGSPAGTVFTPAEGWGSLWSRMNSNSCTAQVYLQWVTDVQHERDFRP
jgi:hypothetical protein